MQLDRIKFGRLISFITLLQGKTGLDGTDIGHIDMLTTQENITSTGNSGVRPISPGEIQIIGQMLRCIGQGKKIEAIKRYRELRPTVSLLEAKNIIETAMS